MIRRAREDPLFLVKEQIRKELIWPALDEARDWMHDQYSMYFDASHIPANHVATEVCSRLAQDIIMKNLQRPVRSRISYMSTVDGEFAKDSRIRNANWYIRHSILEVTIDRCTFFVDPCWERSAWVHPDATSSCIYTDKMPDWFDPNQNNIKFSSWNLAIIRITHGRFNPVTWFQEKFKAPITNALYNRRRKRQK